MTADTTARPPFQASALVDTLRRGFAMMLKLIMGGMVVLAAGILAVAIAIVGMLLAAVAVVYRMVSGDRAAAPKEPVHKDGITLDAHRTANGWTVE